MRMMGYKLYVRIVWENDGIEIVYENEMEAGIACENDEI